MASTLYSDWCTQAREEQIPLEGDWNIWLILAGRGWGKTRTGAMDVISYGLANPESQIAVVVPTFGDLRRVAFGGVSGILANIPPELLLEGRGQGYNAANQEIRLFNGTKIMGFSATNFLPPYTIVHGLSFRQLGSTSENQDMR